MCCRLGFDRLQRQHGLTLVELLVAMLILSLVMTLVAQAVSQTAHVARAAQESSQELHSSWTKGWVLRDVLTNLAAPPEGGDRPLQGDGEHINGFALQGLSGPRRGVQPFKLRLAKDPQSGQQHLIDELWDNGSGEIVTAAVARFARPMEFAYVDERGEVRLAWPPPDYNPSDAQAAALPRAVVLRDRDSHEALLWFPFMGDTRRQLVKPKMFWEQ